jgi:predicted O-methyltransferase YrrM
VRYSEFLSSVHSLLRPQRYLEIGVRTGMSLALARCRSVGIDPAYSIEAELDADVALFRTTSDEYFARPDPLAPVQGQPFDLTFIDGMHLFEFALRDFINVERCSRDSSVVIFDDMLPRSVEEAARERHTRLWTGDLYPIIEVLARYRPEVATIPVDTQPTGLLLVAGLDPANTVLADHYDEIIAAYRRPDPQPVPQILLDRLTVQPPRRVLEAGFWRVLDEQRMQPSDGFHRALRIQLAADLGPRYAPQD